MNVAELFQSARQKHGAGEFAEAESLYARILQQQGSHAESWQGLALLAEQRGQTGRAADAYAECGRALLGRGQVTEAEHCFRQALEHHSDHVPARTHLSLVLWEWGRLDEAEACARGVLNRCPDSSGAWQTVGLVAARRHCYDEAIASLERALVLQPDLLLARNHLAVCLGCLGRHDESLAHCETALRLQPDNPHARFNRAQLWLSEGRYRDGWLEYEWRWRTGQCSRPAVPRPRWDGSPRSDQALMVHSEQGLGDVIQFIRLLPQARDRCGRIVLACSKALHELLSRCEGIDEWMPIDEPTPIRFDVYTSLLSLPGLLEIDETNLPRDVPYVFADAARVERWRPVLTALEGFRVGICWQGSATFQGDAIRSIPLAHYAALARVPNVHLISLQKGYGSEQVARVRDEFSATVLEGLDEAGGAFVDTAAVMQHLDLVVTSDTATAHLAGALGVPVWVALSTAANWRWLRDREDSPWYPTMRLFRQQAVGEWEGVFGEIAEALERRVASPAIPIAGVARVGPEPVPSNARSEQNRRCRSVTAEIAPGELIDKITILEIKRERISDRMKRDNVRRELAMLEECRRRSLPPLQELTDLSTSLKRVNEELWAIEDAVRDCERRQDFGTEFIRLARSVYGANDRRARLKREINDLLGAQIVEEKSYSPDGENPSL